MGARPEFGDKPVGGGLWSWLRDPVRSAPLEPAVSRAEVAAWYARALAPHIEDCVGTLGRPGILIVRCRDHSFQADLRDGLSAVLTETMVCEVVPNLPAEPEALKEVSRETVDAVNAGRTRVFVVAHERQLSDALPVVDAVVPLPRFNPLTLAQACQSFYELLEQPTAPPFEPWVAQVGPFDLLISSDVQGDPIPAIRATVLRRLQRSDCSTAAPLESLLGLNEVRTWATALIEDIRDALDPEIRCSWCDVERAVVFAGPPGVGRASLSRAIARATGLQWMRASARRWTAALEPIRAIQEDFDAARSIAPAILIIEELDSLDPNLALELGREIEAHADHEPLVVIGSCTDEGAPPDEVLRRARFEQTVYLPLPNAQVLAHKLRERFQAIPHELNEAQVLQVGRLALGGTAEDLDLYIRRAQKIARRDGKATIDFDVMASAILETPDVHARPKVSDRDLEETAYHEAGHTVTQFLEIANGQQLQFVTIVPRRKGGSMTLGFVLRQREDDQISMSRTEALTLIRSSLGGLAAEELLRGREYRSTGASSDLAFATRLAAHLIGRCGLGDRGSLVSRTADLQADPRLAREVDQLLRRQYRQTIDLLRKNWDVVDTLAKRLLVQQELSGDEARAVMQEAVRNRFVALSGTPSSNASSTAPARGTMNNWPASGSTSGGH